MLLPRVTVKERLIPFFYKFTAEKIYAVRKAAAKNLSFFLEKFKQEKDYLKLIINSIKSNYLQSTSF
jgi:hypothetical protein